jgi:carboxylesterase type B
MIFGNSGGGMAVHSLLLSNMTTGLFSSAVMQSGNTIRRFAYTEDASGLTTQLANEVGCEEYLADPKSLVQCLRKLDAKDLVLTEVQDAEIALVKEPIPENGDTSNTFLTDYPWNLIQKGWIQSVPIISGDVSEESMNGEPIDLLLSESATKEFDENFDELLPSIIGLTQNGSHEMGEKFREVYFEDKPISNDTRTRLGVLNLYTDVYVHPQRISALEHSRKTKQPVFMYWLTKQPARTYGEKYVQHFPPPYGVAHADELQYFFLYEGYPEITSDSPWFNYSETLVRMWVDFAATGKPSSSTNEWKPINPTDNGLKWFELGDEFREVEPATERMLLWDEYIPELYWP